MPNGLPSRLGCTQYYRIVFYILRWHIVKMLLTSAPFGHARRAGRVLVRHVTQHGSARVRIMLHYVLNTNGECVCRSPPVFVVVGVRSVTLVCVSVCACALTSGYLCTRTHQRERHRSHVALSRRAHHHPHINEHVYTHIRLCTHTVGNAPQRDFECIINCKHHNRHTHTHHRHKAYAQ